MPINFSRSQLPLATTLARQISRQNLHNLNNVYWVGERSHSFLRRSFASIPMPAPAPGVHGCFRDATAWQEGTDDFRVWRRQHVLISIASLLEVYVKSAAIASFSSKPDLIDRSFSGIDSIEYLKFPEREKSHIKTLINDRADSFTNGLWKDRFRRMEIIFGSLDQRINDLEGGLQSIQNIRNKIAHAYGTNGDIRKTPWEPKRAVEVSTATIDHAVKLVSKTIKLLDEQVFGQSIGCYEYVHEFSIWLRKYQKRGGNSHPAVMERNFRDHIGHSFGSTPGREYNEGMISHYNSIV